MLSTPMWHFCNRIFGDTQWLLARVCPPLQVETLVELRAMHMEDMGKMSRYGPLAMMETAKCGELDGGVALPQTVLAHWDLCLHLCVA